jgi:indolepyruvate ferredoxin oxidoreductase
LSKTRNDFTHALINSHETLVGPFTPHSDQKFPSDALRNSIERAVGNDHLRMIDAKRLASSAFGESLMANMIMLGYAYQLGHIPLPAGAILRAIEVNRVTIDENKQAFLLGRLAAHDPDAIEKWLAPTDAYSNGNRGNSLETLINRRVKFLTAYQNAAYSDKYLHFVRRVQRIESKIAEGCTTLTETVAKQYFRLLAYKDEYEVARLYSDGTFTKRLNQQLEGDYRLTFHFAPPLLPARDKETGKLRKRNFGSWMLPFLKLLAKFKFLRGTAWDIFGYTAERKMERQLTQNFENRIEEILGTLNTTNHSTAVEIADNYQTIRGFGHIKMAQVDIFKKNEEELLERFNGDRKLEMVVV